MARIYDEELAEVSSYLDTNGRGARYVEFQSAVTTEFSQLARQPELAQRIHEVIDRSTNNSAEPLKSRKKIALKLRKWRKTRPTLRPSDIHDIAGLTISCPYPSDVEVIKNHIETHSEDFKTLFVVRDCRSIDQADYKAFHLELAGRGRFINLLCEVQIKTVFARGWGLKTHDLIYKPPGDIDDRLQMHIDKLGQVIKIVDDQSEIVKSLIETAWSLDKRRRYAAQKSLLSEFSLDMDQRLSDLLDRWKQDEAAVSSAAVDSKIINSFDESISDYAEKEVLTLDFCRLACLYALSRPTRDRNDFALNYVDQWISQIDPADTVYRKGLVFLCNALMAMGEYEECIARSTEVIAIAKTPPVKDSAVLMSNLNHAYYLSEAYYHRAFDEPTGGRARDTDETDACGSDALQLVLDHQSEIESSELVYQLQDTVAAVLISCGKTSEQVREGLDLARTVLENARGTPGYDLIASFYELHERRAFTRLLKFD